MDKEVIADRICAASDDFVTMSSDNTYRLYLVELTLDDVGVTCGVKEFSPYSDEWKDVHDMYISNGTLFRSDKRGITRIGLATLQFFCQTALLSCRDVRGIAPFGDQGEMVLTTGNVQVIAVLEAEGNSDGSRALYPQPVFVWVENKKNIFVTDAQVGAVKLITDVQDMQSNFLKYWKTIPGLFSSPEAQATTHCKFTRGRGEGKVCFCLSSKHLSICGDPVGNKQADQWTRGNYCK